MAVEAVTARTTSIIPVNQTPLCRSSTATSSLSRCETSNLAKKSPSITNQRFTPIKKGASVAQLPVVGRLIKEEWGNRGIGERGKGEGNGNIATVLPSPPFPYLPYTLEQVFFFTILDCAKVQQHEVICNASDDGRRELPQFLFNFIGA